MRSALAPPPVALALLLAVASSLGGCGGASTLYIPSSPPSSPAPSAAPGDAEVTALGDAELRAAGFGHAGYVFVTMAKEATAARLTAIARTAAATNGGERIRVAYVRSRSWDNSTTQYTCQTSGVGTGLVSVNCGNAVWSARAGRSTMLVSVWRRDAALAGRAPQPLAPRFRGHIEGLTQACGAGEGPACRALAASGVPGLVARATLLSRGCELGDRHACRLAAPAEQEAHRPEAAAAAAERGCALGSGERCWELDTDKPRAGRSAALAVTTAQKSCEAGDFRECEWLTHALGRREPVVKDDAGYRAADRATTRLAQAACRAGDLEACQRCLDAAYGNKQVAQGSLETSASPRCEAGDVGACAALGHSLRFTHTEKAVTLLRETCDGGAVASCWDYAHALRIAGQLAPSSVELQRLFARSCEHGGLGCGDLESIAEGSPE